MPSKPKSDNIIEFILKSKGIDYVKEHRFHPVRRFKFDFAILDKKIAIEYEGLFSKKSGHTTIKGYTKDCVKYNLAQLMGWVVLRYTAKTQSDLLSHLDMIYNKKR